MRTAVTGLRASIQPLCFSVIRRQVKLVYMQQWENKLKIPVWNVDAYQIRIILAIIGTPPLHG